MNYWIISIPTYGEFVFYGTESEALHEKSRKEDWDRVTGTIRKADRSKPRDKALVCREIEDVELDRHSYPYLDPLPREDWF